MRRQVSRKEYYSQSKFLLLYWFYYLKKKKKLGLALEEEGLDFWSIACEAEGKSMEYKEEMDKRREGCVTICPPYAKGSCSSSIYIYNIYIY